MMTPGVRLRGDRGFTIIEIIAVLLLLGILTAILISKVTATTEIDMLSQESTVKNHVRYAQLTAMKRAAIWGVKCDGTNYWLFTTSNPDSQANQVPFPSEEGKKTNLAAKRITMSSFTVFFDLYGRPYTAYTDEVTNTPVSAANPLAITIGSLPPAHWGSISVTPETGFVP